MAATPQWALDLMAKVCEEEGITLPTLTWRRAGKRDQFYADHEGRYHITRQRPRLSSGRYYPEEHRIVVTAGAWRVDQRMTLLHELAHAGTPGRHHDEAFWLLAFRLFRRHKVPMRHAKERSLAYRKGAIVGIAGA